MKAEWKTITLNDACIQMNGIWKGTKEPLVPAKVLRTTNFSKDCRIKLDDLAIIEVEKKKLDSRRLQRGDIIVEKSGGGPKQPVGRVVLFDMADDDYSFCNFTSALRIKNKEQLDYNFLHKYLTYLYFEGETEKYQSNLVGFRNLDFKRYVEIEVPYPSLTEQQRIGDILDREFAKIDALKANAEKSLQAAKDLFQATLKKELEPKEGWLNTTIGALCESVKYGTSKPSSSTGQYTYLRMNNITNDGFLTLADTKRIDITAEEEEKYLVRKGDILFNRTNSRELVGKTCVFQEEEPMVIAGYIIRLRANNWVNPSFVSFYINYEPVRAELRKQSVGAVHQSNINAKTLQSFSIALPEDMDEQNHIVRVLSDVYRKVQLFQENYQKTLTLCDDLKQSLLRKAFNGEL